TLGCIIHEAALKGRGFQPRRRSRLRIGASAPGDKRLPSSFRTPQDASKRFTSAAKAGLFLSVSARLEAAPFQNRGNPHE
ncbi:MAG: hypothetical protein ACLQBK_02835, partial [Candidatus Sulfotelmatobacter sp.]